MSPEEIKNRIPFAEIRIAASRSGGPGGQNVNKVNTKVELRFNVIKSDFLTDSEKQLITVRLRSRINDNGDLLIISQSERSQLQNRKKAEEKLFHLLAKALTERKKRKPTKPTEASKVRRIEKKKRHSIKKKLRKKSGRDEV